MKTKSSWNSRTKCANFVSRPNTGIRSCIRQNVSKETSEFCEGKTSTMRLAVDAVGYMVLTAAVNYGSIS